MIQEFAPLITAVGALIVSILSAIFVIYINFLQKKFKRDALLGLLEAELRNLATHCRLSANEISVQDPASLRLARYTEGRLLFFDAKEAYYINEYICQDVMQISLHSRNTDTRIEYVIEQMNLGNESINKDISIIRNRLRCTEELCNSVLKALSMRRRNIAYYDKPQIDW